MTGSIWAGVQNDRFTHRSGKKRPTHPGTTATTSDFRHTDHDQVVALTDMNNVNPARQSSLAASTPNTTKPLGGQRRSLTERVPKRTLRAPC
jgi:hypothetical protein